MPTDNQTVTQWNPVQEFHQNWPNSGLSDSQILTNLQDPTKFRSAFPHYTGVTDQDIQTRMKSYLPTGAPGQAPASGPPVGQPIADNSIPMMGAAPPPSLWQRAKNAVESGIPYFEEKQGLVGRQLPAMQLITPEAAMTPMEQQRHPILTGAGQFAGSMTTPENAAMWAASGGLGALPGVAGQIVPRLVGGAFSAQMLKSAYDTIPAVKTAIDQGNWNEAERLMTIGGLTAATAGLTGWTSIHGDHPLPVKTPEQAFVESAAAPKAVDAPAPAVEATSTPTEKITPETPNVAIDLSKLNPVDRAGHMAGAVASVINGEGRDPLLGDAVARELGIKPNAAPGVWQIAWDAWKTKNLNQAKIAPDIVPSNPPEEGLSSLTPEEQDTAREAIARIKGKAGVMASPADAPLKKMVEDAGGQWNGSDGTNAHYDLPPSMTGGVAHVSVATAIEQMTPEMVLKEFERKANAYSSTPTQEAPTPQQQTQSPQSTLDLLPQLKQTFNQITKYSAAIKNATNRGAREQAVVGRNQHMAIAAKTINDLTSQLPADQLSIFRDYAKKIADSSLKQADFIDDAVDTHNRTADARKTFTAMRATGYTEQASGKGNIGGDEGLSVERQAETAPLSRSMMDQLQGRKPRVTINDLVPRKMPEGTTPEVWNPFMEKLKGKLQAQHDSIMRDAQILLDTGESIGDSDLPSRWRELDNDVRMYGKFPAAPASPGARPSLGGETIAPAEGITLKRAQQMLGRRLERIPEMNEFTQKADELRELSSLHRAVGKAIDAKIGLKPVPRAGERGAVGETPSIALPDKQTLLNNAENAGLDMRPISDNKPAGVRGWLSEDGKTWIGIPNDVDHDSAAWELMGKPGLATAGDSQKAMFDNGFMAKESNRGYRVGRLTPKNINTIEHAALIDGTHGQRFYIDEGTGDRPNAIELQPGWGEMGLAKAVSKTRSHVFSLEAGKAPGYETMGGMAAGMAVGFHAGGIPGAFLGGTIGAVTPSILRSAVVANAVRYTRGIRSVNGLTLAEWFKPPIEKFSISPEMDAIREKQIQSLKAPEATLAYRIRLTGNMWKALDPFALITDRPNPIQDLTMKYDPRGKGFRDAKGQLSLDESGYVAVRTGISGIRGGVSAARTALGAIESDAQKAGLHEATTTFLNLKQYQRAYQVVDEHMQALANETQQLKQQLATEDDVVKQVGLYSHIESNTEALKDMSDRYKSGKIVPGGYTPDTINRDLQAIQQKLTPQQMGQVQDFAKRVWAQTRQHLDIGADVTNKFKEGIIGEDEYNTYTSRGDEYIPMKRILENAADANKQFYGKNSPLHLRQQNIIHQFGGSELTNVDPWQAAADGNAEIVREQMRNKTIGTFLDAAKKSPDIAPYFRKVPADYKAAAGEMVVGHYEYGTLQRYAVPDHVGLSLDTSSPLQAQGVLRTMNEVVKNVFKTGSTIASPLWILGRQFPNIVGRMIATAEGPMNPKLIGAALKDAFISTWTHDDKWMEALKTGLQRNSLMNAVYPEARIDNYKLGWSGPLGNMLKNPIDGYRQLIDFGGQWAQLTAFNRLRQAGYSEKAAAFKVMTRGPLPDYAQLGKADGMIASMTTFIRADWAHIRSDLALATDKDYRGKLALTLGAIMLPAIALALHNVQQTDDKGQSMWAQVSNSDKERYWIALTGGKDKDGNPNYKKIMGKPDFVQTYGNPMEDAMYKIMGDVMHKNVDPRPLSQLIANTASRFIPGHPNFDANNFKGAVGTGAELLRKTGSALWQNLTPSIRVPVEEKFNEQDQFGNMKPIVTDTKQSPYMQGYGAKNISPTAMDIGRTLGASPQRIEHIMRGTLGTGARNIESVTDPLLRNDWERNTNLGMPDTQGANKGSSLISGTPINQKDIDAQTKFYNSVQQVAAPYKDYLKMKQVDPDAAMQFMKQHGDEISKGKLAMHLASRLSEVDQKQKELEAMPLSPLMNQAQKDGMIKNHKDVKMQILNSFQGMIEPKSKVGMPAVGTGNATSQGVTPNRF